MFLSYLYKYNKSNLCTNNKNHSEEWRGGIMSLIIPEKLPDSVDKAVSNLTEKPTKVVGTTFGDIWFLVFGGFSQLADKRRVKYQVALEEYERECRARIEAVPEEKRIEPDVQIAAAALEASKYCVENEEVRKMFANLIASTTI